MDNQSVAPLTLNLTKTGLAAGTTTTFSTGGATTYAIKGKLYSTNQAANAATPTTDAVTGSAFTGVAVNKGSVFVFGYDGSSATAATAVKVVQGSIESLDAAGNFIKAPDIPGLPDTICPIGYVTVKVGSTGSTWTFGSSNLAGPPTGVTFAFQDVMTIPARPQVS